VRVKKDAQIGIDPLSNSSAIYDEQGLRHITNIDILMAGSHRDFDV
jgi:hypothetical protein